MANAAFSQVLTPTLLSDQQGKTVTGLYIKIVRETLDKAKGSVFHPSSVEVTQHRYLKTQIFLFIAQNVLCIYFS